MTALPIHLFLTPKISTKENRFRFATFHSEKSIREFITEDIKNHSRKISIVFGKIRIDSLFIILSEYLKICLEDGWGCMEIIDGSGSRWGDETTEECEEYEDEECNEEWEQEWDDQAVIQEALGRSQKNEECKEGDEIIEEIEEQETINRITELEAKEEILLPTSPEILPVTYHSDEIYKSLPQRYRDIVDDISEGDGN